MLTDPYFSTDRNVDRLLEQYKLHGKLIVAFDFDDTIYDYHKKGYGYDKVRMLLLQCHNIGFSLIMLSTKEDDGELQANKEEAACIIGIPPKVIWVNEGPIMPKAKKPFFNIYLDDKAGLGQAYDILNQTVQLIRRQG